MKVTKTALPGVLILEPRTFSDDRGFLFESWNSRQFREIGLEWDFVQDNHAFSRGGALRGLHYQIEHAQGKLVRAATGRIWDVAVDLRRSSPSFGHWFGTWLSGENHCLLWIPPGCAHGYYVDEPAHCLYKCTDFYQPEFERTIAWDDPDLGIAWPITKEAPPSLSQKDLEGTAFRNAECFD
jgi:dTDP-4-dehydrorhamnose 3,5-epimerase